VEKYSVYNIKTVGAHRKLCIERFEKFCGIDFEVNKHFKNL
jgi:hypothetical protein